MKQIKMHDENVLSFEKFSRERERKKQKHVGYHCFVTSGRLKGVCELLIWDLKQQSAELFYLNFSTKGLRKQAYVYQNQKIRAWIAEHTCKEITYRQAIVLLGDAVQQSYRYQDDNRWINHNPSLHLQCIWNYKEQAQLEPAGNQHWEEHDEITLLQIYLHAISNKDGALLYDLLAEQARPEENRDMYMMQWNHVLEEFKLLDLELIECFYQENGICTLFAILRGIFEEQNLLEVDFSLQLIWENHAFYVLRERVLEARRICPNRVPADIRNDVLCEETRA